MRLLVDIKQKHFHRTDCLLVISYFVEMMIHESQKLQFKWRVVRKCSYGCGVMRSVVYKLVDIIVYSEQRTVYSCTVSLQSLSRL